ncbi:MAG TPA: hypothetical protein VJS67_13405 [Pseudonocardiaceae bacterium]|nr:hypothetical protein [Pseudonocardiaceae bacterium]
MLTERGDLDAAIVVLRSRAGAGDGEATGRLVDLLAKQGDIEGLRREVLGGNDRAA